MQAAVASNAWVARAWRDFSRDQDRRRATLLSLVVHLLLLYLVIANIRFEPTPASPTTTYLVIDVGPTNFAEAAVAAAAVDVAARQGDRVQVAGEQVGVPVASTTPQTPAAPAPATQTAQPTASAAAPAAAAATTTVTPPTPLPQPPTSSAPALPPTPQTATPLPTVALPTPEVAAAPERIPVPLPQADTLVSEPRAIDATPQAANTAPTPAAAATRAPSVAAPATPTPISSAPAAATAARPVATPDVRTEATPNTASQTAPQVSPAQAQAVAAPSVRAPVQAAPVAPVAAAVAAAPANTATVVGNRVEAAVGGGDANTTTQVGGETVEVPGQGAAGDPGGEVMSLAAGPARTPPAPIQLLQPIAVLVDNCGPPICNQAGAGRPVEGITAAGVTVEMPVEGGSSRLLLVFNRDDAPRVGPVRSARPYFVEVADAFRAALVHAGGSPDAVTALANRTLPNLNTMTRDDVFVIDRSLPLGFNTFSPGAALRAAIARLNLGGDRLLAGLPYQPPSEARAVQGVSFTFGSAQYTSGFRFDAVRGSYRWLRAGEPATDALGAAVWVDAVLVGAVEARAFDSEGRLRIPMRGGEATLYVGGRALSGRWSLRPGEGVAFVSAAGDVVELAHLKLWVAFTPTYATRVETP